MKPTTLEGMIDWLWRIALVGAAILWGTWFLASIRTSGFGFAYRSFWGPFVVTAIYVAPAAVLALIGVSWRRMAVGTAVVCLIAIAASEVFGWAQEALLLHEHGLAPEHELSVRRWWPFEHHSIYYSPGYGWTGND